MNLNPMLRLLYIGFFFKAVKSRRRRPSILPEPVSLVVRKWESDVETCLPTLHIRLPQHSRSHCRCHRSTQRRCWGWKRRRGRSPGSHIPSLSTCDAGKGIQREREERIICHPLISKWRNEVVIKRQILPYTQTPNRSGWWSIAFTWLSRWLLPEVWRTK